MAAAVKRRTFPQSPLAAGNTNWPANGSEKGDDMYVLPGGQKKVRSEISRVRTKRREKKTGMNRNRKADRRGR